jgi:hypothetical protein
MHLLFTLLYFTLLSFGSYHIRLRLEWKLCGNQAFSSLSFRVYVVSNFRSDRIFNSTLLARVTWIQYRVSVFPPLMTMHRHSAVENPTLAAAAAAAAAAAVAPRWVEVALTILQKWELPAQTTLLSLLLLLLVVRRFEPRPS